MDKMVDQIFTFYFNNGAISVMASNEEEGQILAEEEAERMGWDITNIK